MAKDNSRNSSGESHRISTSGDIEVSTYLEIAKEMAGEQPAAATEAVSGAEREATAGDGGEQEDGDEQPGTHLSDAPPPA